MEPTQQQFDAASVRESWDRAADAWAHGLESGLDFYRVDFFGPAQVAICGDVAGMRLLDVGCGNGYFTREMARRGARVTGVDLSPAMIEHARRHELSSPLGVDYVVSDAAEVATKFPAATFDMATSCMALQDMPDAPRVLGSVHTVLRPGARFVASITHPCTDMPFREWRRDENGRKVCLCVDRYFDRTTLVFTWQRWLYEFTTSALHVPLEDWFDWIHGAGFQMRAFREPRPSEEALRKRPELADAAMVPYYIIFDLVRPA